jgi:hypothetical protein
MIVQLPLVAGLVSCLFLAYLRRNTSRPIGADMAPAGDREVHTPT